MQKEKVKFKRTNKRLRFDSLGLRLEDGDTAEVSKERADHLFRHFAENFEKIGQTIDIPEATAPAETGPPVHKPLTLADITVVVINPYPEVFRTHFLPCIPKEVEFMPLENINNIYWTSGAKALNYGMKIASNDIVMCAHPDLVLGKKWWENFIYHEARLESWGALGVVGWDFNNTVTWGNDVLSSYKVHCLDENCVIVNRKNNIWFDETMFPGWHCFAADYCLQCYDKGLGVYVMPGVAQHEGYSFAKVPGFMQDRDRTLPILWKKWKGKVPRINMGLLESKFRGEI